MLGNAFQMHFVMERFSNNNETILDLLPILFQ